MLSPEDESRLNASARFLPQREDNEYSRPCVEIGGVQVYVYFGDGVLRVSAH